MILADDEQLLARGGIISFGHTHTAFADLKPLDDGETERAGVLNDTTTHRLNLDGISAAQLSRSDVAPVAEHSCDWPSTQGRRRHQPEALHQAGSPHQYCQASAQAGWVRRLS